MRHFQSADGKKFLSFDYSGSMQDLTIINLESCKVTATLVYGKNVLRRQ